MTPALFLWWFVPLRTLFGAAAIVIALVMLHTYSGDRWRMLRRGVNGIVEAIIGGEMRDARMLVMILVWLTLLSAMGWARLYRDPPVTSRDVFGAVILGITLAHIGVLKILRWRSYFKIVELAERVEDDAKSARRNGEQRVATHDAERLDDRVARVEVAKTLGAHIERGIAVSTEAKQAASDAYHEANSVNAKIAELAKDIKTLSEQHSAFMLEMRAALIGGAKKKS